MVQIPTVGFSLSQEHRARPCRRRSTDQSCSFSPDRRSSLSSSRSCNLSSLRAHWVEAIVYVTDPLNLRIVGALICFSLPCASRHASRLLKRPPASEKMAHESKNAVQKPENCGCALLVSVTAGGALVIGRTVAGCTSQVVATRVLARFAWMIAGDDG